MPGRFKQLTMLIGDTVGLYLALFLALLIRWQTNPWPDAWSKHWPIFSLIFAIWLAVFYLCGLYDLRKTKNSLSFFGSFLGGLSINLLLTTGFFYLLNFKNLSPKTILLIIIAIYLPLFFFWRLFIHYIFLSATFGARLLFLGISAEAWELISLFSKNPQYGYKPLAIFSEEVKSYADKLPSSIEVLAKTDNLLETIKSKKINTIILVNGLLDDQLKHFLYEAVLSRLNIYNIDPFFENFTHRVPLSALSESWFLANLSEPQKNAYNLIKRVIDVLTALLMIALFLALFIPIALAIYLCDRHDIFYKQIRMGRDGKMFTIFKFRTMIPEAEENGPQFARINDSRVTKVGKILRLLRLDELPQAINILLDDMSFIGPRPERPEFIREIQKIMPFYNARHLIKPGLTGWAQVNYNYTDSFEGNLVKLQYDLFYIKNRNFLLDAITLLKTINAIIKRTGR